MITRSDPFENETFDCIQKKFTFDLMYGYFHSPTEMSQTINRNAHRNILIENAPSPYLTEHNNFKVNEGVIYLSKPKLLWRFECKSQVKYSDMAGRVLLELNYVLKTYEDLYYLILKGSLMTPSFLKIIADTIHEKRLYNKIKFGTLPMFMNDLLKYSN